MNDIKGNSWQQAQTCCCKREKQRKLWKTSPEYQSTKGGLFKLLLGQIPPWLLFFIFLTCLDHFWCSRNFSSSKSLQDLLLSSTTAVSEQSNMRFESERELCCRRSTPLSRLGRTGELEWAPLIADSGNPLLLSLLHPDELWQRGHLQLQASVPPDFFFFFLWAGGTGGRLKGICDLIITPSPHLSDPAASISLSAPLSLALSHRVTPLLSLPLALYCSLSPSIFHPISVSSVSLCIPSLNPTLCRLWPPLCVGGRRIGDSVLRGGREAQSENKPSKMRTSLILPQINRLGEMMPVREWIRIYSRYCDPLGVCTDYFHMHRHIPRGKIILTEFRAVLLY